MMTWFVWVVIAAVVMAMICVNVAMIFVARAIAIRMPMSWVVAVVIRRMPIYPCRTPEPVVNYRTINIYRLNDVICSINIFVANNLNGNVFCSNIFFYKDSSNVLVNVFC